MTNNESLDTTCIFQACLNDTMEALIRFIHVISLVSVTCVRVHAYLYALEIWMGHKILLIF